MVSHLTERELANLEQQMNKELLLTRKFRQYGDLSEDPELRSLYMQLSHLHQGHFNILLKNLHHPHHDIKGGNQ